MAAAVLVFLAAPGTPGIAMTRRRLVVLLAACILIPGASAVRAQMSHYYVNLGAVGGDGTCLLPFGTVAEAVTAASDDGFPVEIRIAGGPAPGGLVYNERGLTVNFSEVHLLGGYDPASFTGACDPVAIQAARDGGTLVTVIDAQRMDRHFDVLPVRDTSMPPMFVRTNIDIMFDRITFRNGQPQRMVDPLNPARLGGSGGSMIILNCEVAISNCVFDGNTAKDHFFGGGAIYMAGYANAPGSFNRCQLDLTDTVFQGNETGKNLGAGFTGSGPGGAIYAADFNTDGTVAGTQRNTFINAIGNTFRNNVSNGSDALPIDPYCLDDMGVPAPNADCDTTAGAESCRSRSIGGAIFMFNVGGVWDQNTFDSNRALARQVASTDASGQGGAIAQLASSQPLASISPVITNNTFLANVADAGQGTDTTCGFSSAWGGALYLAYFNAQFTGNLVEGNVASGTGDRAPNVGRGGGAFVVPLQQPFFEGNVFRANSVTGSGGVASWGGGLSIQEFATPAEPIVSNNTFEGNTVTGSTAGSAYGGGLLIQSQGANPLVAGNLFENNDASGAAGQFSGVGGGVRIEFGSPTGLVADNVVRSNTATAIISRLVFAGMTLLATAEDDQDAAPRLQNNLIVDNFGTGLGLIGFPTAMSFAYCSPDMFNNTIARNTGPGISMNLAHGTLVDGCLIYENSTGSTLGDIDDEFLLNSEPTAGMVVRFSDLSSFPPVLDATVNDPANANFIAVDPQWVTGSVGPYYLAQPPDQPAASNGLVDAVPVAAGGRDFGTNPAYMGQNMALRTTKNVSETSDICFTDMGWHGPLAAAPVDADMDFIPDADEPLLGTSPADADSDDDGVVDGLDCGGDVDMDGTIAALDCDADGDGLTDGTEVGVPASGVGSPGADTNRMATCDTSNAPCGSATASTFTGDADVRNTTDPLNPDTDGGGELDGCEDINQNGRIDAAAGDRNPNNLADDDADRDGFNNGLEDFLLTDRLDADTDDDGVSDGAEAGSGTDPLQCDTELDGIMDGIEVSLGPVADPDGPGFPARGTDVPRRTDDIDGAGPFVRYGCAPGDFVVDADAGTQTDPILEDTDGDTCLDGAEDANRNGAVDGAETNPLVADCVGGRALRINEDVTALIGGSGACGPPTIPSLTSISSTTCGTPQVGCAPGTTIVNSTRCITNPPALGPEIGSPVTVPDGALAGAGCLLVLIEMDGCDVDLLVGKSGTNLVLTAR
jgi:hypothetical protein